MWFGLSTRNVYVCLCAWVFGFRGGAASSPKFVDKLRSTAAGGSTRSIGISSSSETHTPPSRVRPSSSPSSPIPIASPVTPLTRTLTEEPEVVEEESEEDGPVILSPSDFIAVLASLGVCLDGKEAELLLTMLPKRPMPRTPGSIGTSSQACTRCDSCTILYIAWRALYKYTGLRSSSHHL